MGANEASVLRMIVENHKEFCEPFRLKYFSEAVEEVEKIDGIHKTSETLSEDEDCIGLTDDAYYILFLLYDSHIKRINKKERSSHERKDVARQLTEQLRTIVSGLQEFAAADEVDLGKVIEYRHALQAFLKELRWDNIPTECSIDNAFHLLMGPKEGHAKPAKNKSKTIRNPVRSKSEGYSLGNGQGLGQSSKAKDEAIEISDSGTESDSLGPSASRSKTTKTTQKAAGKVPIMNREPRRSQTYDGGSRIAAQRSDNKSKLSSQDVAEEEEEEELPISSGQYNPPPPPYSPPQRVNGPYAAQHQASIPTNAMQMGFAPNQVTEVPYNHPWFGTHVPGHGSGSMSAPPAPVDPYQANAYQPHPGRVMSAPPDTLQFHPAALQVVPWLTSQNQPGSSITITDCFNVKNETVGMRNTNRRATDLA